MTERWYVLQVERNKERSAEDFVRALEFEPYVPRLMVRRRINGKLVDVSASRFGIYIFARFDWKTDPWGHLTHSKGKRCGIVRVMTSYTSGGEPWPIPVPDGVIETIKAYTPPFRPICEPYRYHPGEPCTVTIAGVRREAVFMEYCGTRPMVRTWIFGADRVTEVNTAEIEPLNLDNGTTLHTNSAA